MQTLKSRAAKVRTLIAHGKIPSPAWALVINEKALDYTLDRCSQELMEVARACKAVVRCPCAHAAPQLVLLTCRAPCSVADLLPGSA